MTFSLHRVRAIARADILENWRDRWTLLTYGLVTLSIGLMLALLMATNQVQQQFPDDRSPKANVVVQKILRGYGLASRPVAVRTLPDGPVVSALGLELYAKNIMLPKSDQALRNTLSTGEVVAGISLPDPDASPTAYQLHKVKGDTESERYVADAERAIMSLPPRVIDGVTHAYSVQVVEHEIDLSTATETDEEVKHLINTPLMSLPLGALLAVVGHLCMNYIVRHREKGVLEPMASTPLRPVEFLLGKALAAAVIAFWAGLPLLTPVLLVAPAFPILTLSVLLIWTAVVFGAFAVFLMVAAISMLFRDATLNVPAIGIVMALVFGVGNYVFDVSWAIYTPIYGTLITAARLTPADGITEILVYGCSLGATLLLAGIFLALGSLFYRTERMLYQD